MKVISGIFQALRGLNFLAKPAKSAAVKVGSGALTLAVVLLIQPWEGNERVPYLDVGGVPTACGGITGPEITKAYHDGYVFTEEECEALNIKHAKIHADSAERLITFEPVPDLTMAAFISFHYNVGPGAFAGSTLRRKANAGDLRGACDELSRWVRVGNKVVKGLENRRVHGDAHRLSERTVCLIGIDPSYKTPLFERLILTVKP